MIVDDFRTETRFGRPRFSATSASSARLWSRSAPAARQFGGIGVHSRHAQHFSADDAHFLQAVANVIGAAVERARHEEAVRDSEARFRELADTAPALMWMTDAEGDVDVRQRGLAALHGPQRSPRTWATPSAASAHPDDRDDLLTRWRDAFARRTEFRFEYRLPRATASTAGCSRWACRASPGGDFAGYVGTATDIHERKQMEDALRRSEASFRDLADSAPVMIWTTDDRGSVTFVNAGWLAYTGTTLEEELGDELVARGSSRRLPAVYRPGRRRSSGAGARGSASTASAPPRRVPLDLRARRPALRGRPLRRLRRHRARHPRAQADGGAAARGLRARAHDRRDAPAQPAARAPAAHRGDGDRRALPAGRPGRRDRRRLVRRARAGRRPGGARGRRRGRPRPARRGGHGPAAQRLPRLRDGGELARPR